MRHPLVTKQKSWFYSPLVAVALVVVVILSGLSVVRAYLKQHDALEMKNQYVKELQQVNDKQADLSHKIDTLSTERGLEAEVRERYRVVRPGEQLVIVVDNKPADAAGTSQKPSFLKKLRGIFGF